MPHAWVHIFMLVCSAAISAPVVARTQHDKAFLFWASNSSPLNCRYDSKTQIQCDVVDDKVTLTGITFNRGNCPSPFPTEQERTEGRAFLDSLPEQELMKLDFGLPMMILMNDMGACVSGTKSERERRICELAPSLQRVISNPLTTYKFGDHFFIPLAGCDNLLEWTISTDQGDWTWSNSH